MKFSYFIKSISFYFFIFFNHHNGSHNNGSHKKSAIYTKLSPTPHNNNNNDNNNKLFINYINFNLLLSIIPDLSNIVTYFNQTIDTNTNSVQSWFDKIFSQTCTKEVYTAYIEKIKFNKTIMEITKTTNNEFLSIKDDKLIKKYNMLNPFFALRSACESNTIPLILIDFIFGFLNLPSIEKHQKEDIIDKMYYNILSSNKPRIFFKNISGTFTTIKFLANELTKYLIGREKTNFAELINNVNYYCLKPYTTGIILRNTLPNSKQELIQKIINTILATHFLLKYPGIIVYELGLKDFNEINKEPYHQSAFESSVKMPISSLERLAPSELTILKPIIPTLLYLIHFPYEFGQYTRGNLKHFNSSKTDTQGHPPLRFSYI